MNHSRRHRPRLRPVARLDASWLRFLLLEGLSDAEVTDALVSDDLPAASVDELRTFRMALDVPLNFDPSDSRHISTQAYLHRHGVALFYQPNGEAAAAVLRLLRAARPRELVEAALLVDVPVRAVVVALDKYLGFSTDASTIEAYKPTFFNIDGLSRAQLRAAVERRVRVGVTRVVGDDDERAVQRAVAADGRVVAANLPRTRLTWASVMTALGWQPAAQDVSRTLNDLENLALIRAGEALARGAEDDARRAEGYVGVLERLRALRDGLVDPNETLVKTFGRLRLVQDASSTLTVGEMMERGDEVSPMQEGPSDHEAAETAEGS